MPPRVMSASDDLDKAIEANLAGVLNRLGFQLADSRNAWWGDVRTYRRSSVTLEIIYEIRDTMLEVRLAQAPDDAPRPYTECLRKVGREAEPFEQACGGWDEEGLLVAKLSDALEIVGETLPIVLAHQNGREP